MIPAAIIPAALAQPEPQLARIPPKHILSFGDLGNLFSAALSPDGKHLYVLIHSPYIDLGGAVATYWPEALGALCALVVLALFTLVILRARRRQDDQLTHCRRCNYVLESQPPAHCPECGADLARRRPVRGRAAWRRVRLPLALAIITAGAYAWVRVQVPRGADWAHPAWRSGDALTWPNKRGLGWLARFRATGDLVLEVDAATGKRTREVCRRPVCSAFQLCLTPDGAGCYLERATRDGIDLVSLATGAAMASYTTPYGSGPNSFKYDFLGHVVIGHAPDASAYLSYWNADTGLAYAVRWTPDTGKTKLVGKTPAFMDKSSGGEVCEGRQFLLAGPADKPDIVSVPLFMEAYSTSKYEVRWFDRTGDQYRHVDVTDVSARSAPLVDGRTGFLPQRSGDSFVAVSLYEGEDGLPWRLPNDDKILGRMALSADGHRLLVPGGADVYVHDLNNHAWLAALAAPKGFFAPRAVCAPNPRRVAAVFQGRSSATGPAPFVAAIWDLPSNLVPIPLPEAP